MILIRRNRGTADSKAVDTFWNLVKGGLTVGGAVGSLSHPALGLLSIGAETINQAQSWIANRRSNELTEDVADGLYSANQEGKLTIEQIQQVISSEQFTSALMQARFIVIRTHQDDKKKALRNAVLNVAIGKAPDEDKQALFLALLERYDQLHLRLLRFFQNPTQHGFVRPTGTGADKTAVYNAVLSAFPDLRARFDVATEDENFVVGALIQSTIQNLSNDRLLGVHGPFVPIPNFSTEHWTTALGNAFLQFISTDIREVTINE